MSDTDTVDIQKHNQNQATIRSKESNNPLVSFWLSNETTKKKFVKTGTLTWHNGQKTKTKKNNKN